MTAAEVIAEAIEDHDGSPIMSDEIAAHVVLKLRETGYTIIETERHERLIRGANELGRRLGRQLKEVLDLTAAHDLIDEDGDGDWMRVWERLGELVEKGRQYEAARRIDAATTTDEVRAVVGEFLHTAVATTPADSDFDRGPHLLGFIVGTTEHDTVMRMTLGDVEGSLHATKDEAEGELIQCWAEGFNDHEIFEVRAFRKVDR